MTSADMFRASGATLQYNAQRAIAAGLTVAWNELTKSVMTRDTCKHGSRRLHLIAFPE